jgi:hypothetical protein
MLKQILATTAVLAIVAVSVQSANAANGQFRQIVVEPAGGSADDLLLKKNKKVNQLFILKTGQGIPTPPVGAVAGKTGGKPVANFIVAPGNGIPSGNGGIGKPAGSSVAQFVVAPGAGIPSGGAGPANGKSVQPFLLKVSGGGIPTKVASADPGNLGQGAAFPVIANPSELTTPAGTDGGASGSAGATPAAVPAAGPQPVDVSGPAVNGGDNGGAPASEAPAGAAPANPAPVIQTPANLYSVLIAHGYGVEILQSDASGNLVFYVTTPGNPEEADLLLVDAEYGKVLERKHIAAYAYGYDHAATYAPRYAPAYASNDDNCDHDAGY